MICPTDGTFFEVHPSLLCYPINALNEENGMKSLLIKGVIFTLLLLLVGFVGGWKTELIGGKETPTPNVLRVTSTGPLPGYHFTPVNTTIYDVSSVQHLYNAAYALPTVPLFSRYACPLDTGLVYHLTFLHDTTVIQTMDLSATGCKLLHIASSSTRRSTDSFNMSLAHMLNRTSLQPDLRP